MMSNPSFWLVTTFLAVILTGFCQYRYNVLKDEGAKKREIQMSQKIDGVDQGNKMLQEKLKPFEQLASNRYPGMETDAALGKLYREIQEVRKETALLNERTASRRLIGEQAQKVTTSLKKHSSQTVMLTSVMGDGEAFQFATDIKSVLEAGGWKVDGVNQAVFSGPIKGVLIKVAIDPPPEQALWLFEALKAGGLRSSGMLDKQLPPDRFELLVGSKE